MSMFKKLMLAMVAMSVVSFAFAGTWVKVRGTTAEDAFYNAQEKYGLKFVKRGSCGSKQQDGYIYCDALIED